MNKSIAILALAATALTASARYHAPYDYPRVLWDISSEQRIFETGNYARLITLQDGRLIAAAESYGPNGIKVCYSNDNGDRWTTPELIAPNPVNNISNCVPDLIQLTDGTIIVGYNPRPHGDYTVDRRFGIRCVRSTDNGETWSDPIYIYDASHTFEDGCWEPSFLEMPDGELHCYFANEHPYTSSGEQEISLCRSFDKGLTWSAPERVTFRAGHRDGMPSAIITAAGDIVVIVEDNGQPGYNGFRATTMRCTVEQNWHDCWVDGNSPNRHMIFANNTDKQNLSAAPYIRRLRNDYTLASWQGTNPLTGGLDMFTAVGNKDALRFKQVAQPFHTTDGDRQWNSVNVAFDNRVFALSSHGGIYLMKGSVIDYVKADFGTPTIDASYSKDPWTSPRCEQIVLGQSARTRGAFDFLYDNECLYMLAFVSDNDQITDRDTDRDGVYLTIDTTNNPDNYPQDGMYRIFFDIDGSVKMQEGHNNRWNASEASLDGIRKEFKIGRTYYVLEVAIPWSVFGWGGPRVEQTMRMNIEINDIRKKELRVEGFPDAVSRQSWTWPEFRLTPSENVGIVAAEADASGADAPVEWFNLQGLPVANPAGGIFIRRQGTKVTKEFLK